MNSHFKERRFFDWNTPFLPQVVEALLAEKTAGNRLDLSSVILTFPSQRASNLFKELLFAEVRRKIKEGELSADWRPPQLAMIGVFPELLYPLKKGLANSWTEKLAWREAFRQMKEKSPKKIDALIPNLPKNNFKREMELAALFSRLHRQMASEDLDFSAPYQKTQLIESEKKRWKILKELQDRYLSLLDSYSLWDEQIARSFAVKNKECRTNQEIYLIGAVDLNRLQKKILDQAADRVHIFVFAPEEKADFFDEYGCVIPSKWESIQGNLSEDQLIQAEDPVQEGEWAAHAVCSFPGSQPKLSAKDTLVGIADPDIVPFFTAELLNLNSKIYVNQRAGTPAKENRVFKLLTTTFAYLKSRSFHAFADWIRHPDIESRFRNTHPKLQSSDWLSALDRIQNKYIPDTISSFFTSAPHKDEDSVQDSAPKNKDQKQKKDQEIIDRETLKPVWNWASYIYDSLIRHNDAHNQLKQSLPPKKESLSDGVTSVGEVLSENSERSSDSLAFTLPLNEWPKLFSEFLSRIYPPLSSSEQETKSEEDRQIDEGLSRLYSFFDALVEIPSQLAPHLTASEVLEIILKEAEGKMIPFPKDPNGIDLAGWLDLAWDNRSNLVITGFNSNFIPKTQSGDLFLPNTLKKELGMADNSRLFARDAYLLSAILASRPKTLILFAKKTFDGSAFSPSPLLFTDGGEKIIAQRIDRFFGDSLPSPPSFVNQGILSNTITMDVSSDNKVSVSLDPPKFKVSEHLPNKSDKSPDPLILSVTDFAAFLSSPYRFFLERQIQLKHLNDNCLELNAADFGIITHNVLDAFGKSEHKNSTDENKIKKCLNDTLDQEIEKYQIHHSAGTVLVQIESIRQRLEKFAHWQAQWRNLGWEIVETEAAPPEDVKMPVSDSQESPCVIIKGRIDRIDKNEELGKWIIFDYKTFDKYEKGGKKAAPNGGYFPDRSDPRLASLDSLFNDHLQNTADQKHRKMVVPSFLTSFNDEEERESSGVKTDKPSKSYQWINLQLLLYLYLAKKILKKPFHPKDRKFEDLSPSDYNFIPAYLVLPKSDDVLALAGNWSPLDIEKGLQTAQWVAERIQELWQIEIDPKADVDPKHPKLGKILKDPDFSFLSLDDQKKFFK